MDTTKKKKESSAFNPIINSILNKSWQNSKKSSKGVKEDELNSGLSSKCTG